jgi:hypothetical protein
MPLDGWRGRAIGGDLAPLDTHCVQEQRRDQSGAVAAGVAVNDDRPVTPARDRAHRRGELARPSLQERQVDVAQPMLGIARGGEDGAERGPQRVVGASGQYRVGDHLHAVGPALTRLLLIVSAEVDHTSYAERERLIAPGGRQPGQRIRARNHTGPRPAAVAQTQPTEVAHVPAPVPCKRPV